MIVDCFLFGDEFDVLELRLSLLDSVVDYFVLVEAPKTFSGSPKPMAFAANRDRFRRWANKIIHTAAVDIPPPVPSRWLPEVFQRNCILRGLDSIGSARPDDIILISDVDEIPYESSVLEAAELLRDGASSSVAFELPTSRFRGNWVDDSDRILCPKAYLRTALVNPHHQRYFEPPSTTLPRAGRHMSTLLAPTEVQRKLERFAHTEQDNPRDGGLTHLERCQVYAVQMLGRSLLRQLPEEEFDQILRGLASLRPDLVTIEPLPDRLQRNRYLAVTRLRRNFAPDGRVVQFLDCHAESAVIGALAGLLAPALQFCKELVARPARRRRAVRRKEFLRTGECSPAAPCPICTGEL